MVDNTVLLLLVALVIIVLFVAGNCTLQCSHKEGYTRSCLANDCFGLQRTPVDYAFKYDHGWQRNPHWKANPADKHQPLDHGPIDLLADGHRLENGSLFRQYRSDWKGCGNSEISLVNDEKNRFDLTNIGDQGARNQLDDLYNPRFGPPGYSNNERAYDEPNPTRGKIYGGSSFLKFDRLGD